MRPIGRRIIWFSIDSKLNNILWCFVGYTTFQFKTVLKQNVLRSSLNYDFSVAPFYIIFKNIYLKFKRPSCTVFKTINKNDIWCLVSYINDSGIVLGMKIIHFGTSCVDEYLSTSNRYDVIAFKIILFLLLLSISGCQWTYAFAKLADSKMDLKPVSSCFIIKDIPKQLYLRPLVTCTITQSIWLIRMRNPSNNFGSNAVCTSSSDITRTL